MKLLTVETTNEAGANKLLSFLKDVEYVKSVNLVEPLSESDWIKPGRPATDEEIELLSLEAENSRLLPSAKARAITLKELKKWKCR